MAYRKGNKSEKGEKTMILACQNINKSFGEKVILKDVSFHI